MPLPNAAPTATFDDLQEIENDINELYKTYIVPIENIRSRARPILSSPTGKNQNNFNEVFVQDFKSKEINGNLPLESRAHAFYRMLGLPVVASDGSFYNPGFSPFNSATEIARAKVNVSFYNNSKELANLIYLRERLVEEQRNIFSNSNNTINSVTYALLLRYTSPFAIFDNNLGPLEPDQQKSVISERDTECFIFASFNSNLSDSILEAGNTFKNSQHLLKPFIVDPRIENVVIPDLNKICIPFLKDKKSAKINKDQYLFRPGLELIIRQRLEDTILDENFLKTIENLLSGENKNTFTTSVDYQTLLASVISLSENSNLPNDVKSALQGVTSLQVSTVIKLIKTIKTCVAQLHKSIITIDKIKTLINWVPLCGTDGPANLLGSKLAGGLINSYSDIDTKISELKIKKLAAELKSKDYTELGDFASPFSQNDFGNNIKLYDDQIQQLTNYRDRIANEGFKALQIIEIVKGEVSGLGLVDILAIYAALWSVDLEVLLALLDDESVSRLFNYNPQYQGNPDVIARNNGAGLGVIEALQKFQDKVYTILNFADVYLNENQQRSPAFANNSFIEG